MSDGNGKDCNFYLFSDLVVSRMSQNGMSHEDCLKKVCAICTNLNGKKVHRGVSETEEKLIQKLVFPSYRRGSLYFPQGLCDICQRKLLRMEKAGEAEARQQFILPENYHCSLPHETRSQSKENCMCRWCKLARMNGLELRRWQKEVKERRHGEEKIGVMCPKCGKGLPISQISHHCSSSDLAAVAKMLESIPEAIKPKLAHSLLKELQEEPGGSLSLPPATGGRVVQVQMGHQTSTPKMSSLTHKEVTQMASRNHLTGEQQSSIMADLRCKWGRKIVEPGLQEVMPKHNAQFSPYFTEEQKPFLNTDGNITPKHLYFCHDLVGLVEKVKELRSIQSETEILVQGDTGQGWLKIGMSLIKKDDLKKGQRARVAAAGAEFSEENNEEAGPSKKVRRRQQGIGGGSQFSDWGARKMILLAVVPKVPESHHNIDLIFTAIGLNKIPFKMTGDFAFLMPICGLVKGCGGTNPCPLCDQRKTNAGGKGSRWVEGEVNLRSLGSIHSNYNSWLAEGQKDSAAATMKWKGVCGSPLLEINKNQGRGSDLSLLDLIVPGPLHLFLSVNEIINFLQKTMWPEVKEVLRDVVGVQYHVYMGKVGNYEGPSINKIFRNLEKLEPFMLGGSTMRPFYATLLAFKGMASAVLGAKELPVDWREKIQHLRACILHLHTSQKMSVTPKLHIMITHVEQWVDRFGRSLGKEGEQQGEAVHHIWKRLLESLGQPKDQESDASIKFIMKALLIFNANSV